MKKASLLLILGSLALTACRGGPDTPAPTSVEGRVVEPGDQFSLVNPVTKAWTGGAGKVSVLDDSQQTALASSTLNADGTFSLTLPASVALTPWNGADLSPVDSGCTGNFTVSDPKVQGAAAHLMVSASKSGTIVPTKITAQVDATGQNGTLNLAVGTLLYVDRAVVLSGSQNCQYEGNTATLTANARLNKGWNFLTVNENFVTAGGQSSISVSITSGSLPTNEWLYSNPEAGLLGSASVKAAPRLPKFF